MLKSMYVKLWGDISYAQTVCSCLKTLLLQIMLRFFFISMIKMNVSLQIVNVHVWVQVHMCECMCVHTHPLLFCPTGYTIQLSDSTQISSIHIDVEIISLTHSQQFKLVTLIQGYGQWS